MFLLVLLFSPSFGMHRLVCSSLFVTSMIDASEYGFLICRERLLPLADIITPNVKEASALLGGVRIQTVAEMRAAAKSLHQMGPRFLFSLVPPQTYLQVSSFLDLIAMWSWLFRSITCDV